MTEEVLEFFQKGIIFPSFIADRNFLIWKYIGEEIEFLNAQKEETQKLYFFIQQSAQVNLILSLGQMFDTPNKKYPTRCILSFLDLVEKEFNNGIDIVETTGTINLLKENSCPLNIIDSVTDTDKTIFPKLFSKYYRDKYESEDIQLNIRSLRLLRDKAVAHNEERDTLNFKWEVAEKLQNFSLEIISIFGMAYQSFLWKINGESLIRKNAERDTYFIKANISALKKASSNS